MPYHHRLVAVVPYIEARLRSDFLTQTEKIKTAQQYRSIMDQDKNAPRRAATAQDVSREQTRFGVCDGSTDPLTYYCDLDVILNVHGLEQKARSEA